MKKPLKPLPTDCCGTGCPRCVYEIYERQLEQYNRWKQKADQRKKAKTNSNQF